MKLTSQIDNPRHAHSMHSVGFVLVTCLAVLTCFATSTVAAEDIFDVSIRPQLGEVDGVLVLCPGMNSDGSHFLGEEPWMEFADKHNLGVIALNFSSDPELMYGEEKEGYYWPDQGSGKALLDAVNAFFGENQPILIYGFSGGAQFASRFVEWKPERIKVWAAYSAQFWDAPRPSDITPPGIVACGEYDGARWFPSYAYFYQGRELGKPWTWVSIKETGHFRKGAFERFVRDYFDAVLSQGELPASIFVDISTEELIELQDTIFQPELLSWLPNQSLAESWRKLHNP